MKLLKALRKFRDSKKGITAAILGLVIMLIVVTTIIPIGILVHINIRAAIPTITDAALNASATSLYANIASAFSLSAVLPIVAAAALIIGVIIAAFAIRGRGAGA